MRRLGSATAVVVLMTLAVAACSSKAPPSEPTGSSQPEPSQPEPSQVVHGGYAECLRVHGVTDSAGPVGAAGPPSGVSPAVWEQAMRACSTLAPGPAGP